MSMLAAIRAAVSGEMSTTPAAEPGFNHGRADTMAKEDFDAGVQAGTERLVAALGADGIKGNAKRMAAVLDLAVKYPAMSGEDIAGLVSQNVGSAEPAAESYEAHDAQVAAAQAASPPSAVVGAGLATPSPRAASASGWKSQVEEINAARGL